MVGVLMERYMSKYGAAKDLTGIPVDFDGLLLERRTEQHVQLRRADNSELPTRPLQRLCEEGEDECRRAVSVLQNVRRVGVAVVVVKGSPLSRRRNGGLKLNLRRSSVDLRGAVFDG